MKAFAIEQGWDLKFVSRMKATSKLGVGNEERGENLNRHGGGRHPGVHGLSSADHDTTPVRRMYVNAWFQREKSMTAQEAPNEEGAALYQIDKIDVGLYYMGFVLCCQDLWFLDDSEIANQDLWNEVWSTEHPDLVMREHMNVDHKDKAIFNFMHL